jgi:hypothetical protein
VPLSDTTEKRNGWLNVFDDIRPDSQSHSNEATLKKQTALMSTATGRLIDDRFLSAMIRPDPSGDRWFKQRDHRVRNSTPVQQYDRSIHPVNRVRVGEEYAREVAL